MDAADTTDGTAKFIPYKESGTGGSAVASGVAYPENWREHFGISYEIKQKRDRVIDGLSAADIRNRGTMVINPFIGVIPSRAELEDELEDLYMALYGRMPSHHCIFDC